MSKICIYGIIVQLTIYTLAFATDGHGQNKGVDEIKLSLSLNGTEATLDEVIGEIEKNTGFIFSHIDQEINTSSYILSIPNRVNVLGDFLREIAGQTGLSFHRVNEYIQIRKRKEGVDLVVEEIQVNQTVNGTVTDENGEPLPGATIVEKGTSNGTISDIDGGFTLNTSDDAVLLVSFVGYKEVEVAVQGRTSINVTMEPDVASLEEIVVVGYTSQKKSDITGAVGIVDVDQIQKVTATTVTEALQGRVPGVRVRSSGLPGQTSLIEIRGTNSVRGTKPIYVIDGLITDETRDFNPNDVESIQVLKDAASTAMYGARGANGVVVITTKKGKRGPTQIDFEGKTGIQSFTKRYDLMETDEWARTINMAYDNADVDRIPLADNPPNINTDWQDEFIQQGKIENYNVAIAGGGENGTYRVSTDYFNHQGTVLGTQFERYSTRLTSGFQKDRFQFQETVLLALSNNDELNGEPFVNAIRMFPIIPVVDPNQTSGYGIGSPDAPTLAVNPVAEQRINDFTTQSFRLQGSAFVEFFIFDFLSYKLNGGIDYNNSFFKNFRKEGQLFYSQEDPRSSLSEERSGYKNILVEHTLNFNKQFRDHNLTAVLGYTEQKNEFSSTVASGKSYPRDNAGNYFAVLGNTAEAASVGGNIGTWGFRSLLARVEYDYKGKYLATASFRRDGSSRFSPSNRYGNFPAFSVGWRISNEPFLDALPFLSDLKLRASYGITGDFSALGNYEYTTFITSGLARYILGSGQEVAPGSIQRNLAANNLKWQENISTNFGVDVAFFENKLQLNANYFISRSEDLLLRAPLIWALGNAGDPPYINVGSIENKGFELGALFTSNMGDFRYSLGANLTRLRNKFLELGTGNPELTGGGFSRSVEGEPIGQFYVLKTDGIWQSQEEIEASNIENIFGNPIEVGTQRYVDINGDSIINADDRSFLGSPWPKMEYSFNITLGYKAFDFSMFWNGLAGVTLYNQQRYWLWNTSDVGNYEAGLEPWTVENASTTTPRARIGEPMYGQSDRFLEDASFLRLNNVQLAYNFPSSLLDNLNILRSARIYVTGQNVLTFTKYSGLDPDIKNSDPLARGYDNNAFPNVRTLLVGLQIGF